MKNHELSFLCLEHRRAYLAYSQTTLATWDGRVMAASERTEVLRRQLAEALAEEARMLAERDAHAAAHRLEAADKDAWLAASERYHAALHRPRPALQEAA